MSLLSCAFRPKKKHPKFQLVDLFREKTSISPSRNDEMLEIDKFAEELAKPIVSYQRIQTLSWNGVPSCTRRATQAFVPRFGSTSSSTCSSTMPNRLSPRNATSMPLSLATIGAPLPLLKMNERSIILLTWMLSALEWNTVLFVDVKL